MQQDFIQAISELLSPYLDVHSVGTVEKYMQINDKVILPVPLVSNYYTCDNDIEIFDQENTLLGYLCFCKSSMNTNVHSFSENKLIAFLYESDNISNIPNDYHFKSDYLLVNVSEYERYKNDYFDSAPIWGHYSHEIPIATPVKAIITKLIAIKNIKIPTKYHVENSVRALIEPYSFERFLKWYHLLELLFDYDFVERVKSLDDNIQGIGKLLSGYKGDDLTRLRYVVSTRCENVEVIEAALNRILPHLDKAKEIFFDFGKESNPIKKFDDLYDIASQGGFSFLSMQRRIQGKWNQQDHNDYIIKVSTYWVYRIRCCIAHNKIGEYIMSNGDEKFMSEFGESLLTDILREVFVSS